MRPKTREIYIRAVANGWIVKVGCEQFVYEAERYWNLTDDLRKYLKDPEVEEKKFLEEQGAGGVFPEAALPGPPTFPPSSLDPDLRERARIQLSMSKSPDMPQEEVVEDAGRDREV